MEHLQRLDDLKKQLIELEKQHEKGKPLVNLVDNMVKLGSLYRNGTPTSGVLGSSSMHSLSGIPSRERLEFNYKVQEQRLLAEERRDWDRLSPDYGQLQVVKDCGTDLTCCTCAWMINCILNVFISYRLKSSSCIAWTKRCKRSLIHCKHCKSTRNLWNGHCLVYASNLQHLKFHQA